MCAEIQSPTPPALLAPPWSPMKCTQKTSSREQRFWQVRMGAILVVRLLFSLCVKSCFLLDIHFWRKKWMLTLSWLTNVGNSNSDSVDLIWLVLIHSDLKWSELVALVSSLSPLFRRVFIWQLVVKCFQDFVVIETKPTHRRFNDVLR